MDLCKFEASLVYKASSKIASTVAQRNPILENQKINKKKKK